MQILQGEKESRMIVNMYKMGSYLTFIFIVYGGRWLEVNWKLLKDSSLLTKNI